MRPLLLLGCALLATGCVSGRQLMADAEVISTDVERARRNGAMQCAPVDLAQAEAHLEFGQGELNQGNSGRAAEHIERSEERRAGKERRPGRGPTRGATAD